MNSPLISLLKALRPWLIAWVSVTGLARASAQNSACAPTPADAIEPAHYHAADSTRRDGYRVAAVRWDPLLRQQWATVVTCGHPERPSIAMPMPSKWSGEPQRPPVPLPTVHAGDLVRLWSQSNYLRIETSGIAQEGGAPGNRVRVRVFRSGLDGQQQEQTILGVVRGRNDVEMQP